MYKVQKGDTLEKISRKFLGSEINAPEILKANPDISPELAVGSSIVIPNLIGKPENKFLNVDSNNANEVSLLIDNVRFRFWDTIIINRTIDSIDTVTFTAPFSANDPDFRALFKPFSFQNVSVFIGDDLLFKGILIAVNPEVSDERKIISVSCYSLPGVLGDCTPSASSFPLEYNNLNLQDIAQNIISPFGISVEFKNDSGSIFNRVACDPNRIILDFLIDLAKQRNLILTNSKDGKLIFWRGVQSGNAVAVLNQSQSPLISVKPVFNHQEYYSHITGIEPVKTGNKGSKYTVKNSRLQNYVRPFTFIAKDALSGNIKSAVDAKIGRMFANMVYYEITLNTWRDNNNNLWEPNTNILITAPDAMIYEQYEFTIKSIEFQRQANEEITILNVVFVGSFSGEIPKALPWE